MSNMTTYKIEDCFYLRARIGWQGLRFDEFTDKGPYLVTGTDFVNGKVDWDTCYHVTEQRYRQDTGIQLREHDLLITKDGTIGKIAVVQNCPEKVTLNSGIFVVRAINGTVVPQFLYYILNSHQFYWFMRNILTGSTIKHLNQEHFYKFTFEAPDIDSQRKIAAVLNAADEAIATSRALVEKYMAVKLGLMRDLFTDEGEQIKISRLGGKFFRGQGISRAETTADGIPCIRYGELYTIYDTVTSEVYSHTSEETASHCKHIHYGDLLFTLSGETAEDIGKTIAYIGNEDVVVGGDLAVLTGHGQNPIYLAYMLNSASARKQKELASTGATIAHINATKLGAITIPLPDIERQNEVANILTAADERLTVERERLGKLEDIKRGLMDDLLTNKVSKDRLEGGQEYA